MQDAFEGAAPPAVPENQIAQLAAVELPVGADDIPSEFAHDSGERRLTRLDDLARDHVRVDDRHAFSREQIGDERFAAGDAARESDPERSPDRHQPA
jgi:hypothetical protein